MRRCRPAGAGGSIDGANGGFTQAFYRDGVMARKLLDNPQPSPVMGARCTQSARATTYVSQLGAAPLARHGNRRHPAVRPHADRDVVGAVSVHGVGGAWGTLAAGMFKADALFDVAQMQVQLIGIAAAFLWAFPTTLIAYMILDRIVGVRASSQDEQCGLDYREHFELGYPEFRHDALRPGKA